MKKNRRFMTLCATITLCFMSCTGSLEKTPQVEAIRKQGALRAGVKNDVPRFGYLAPGASEPEGFEVDLARLIAEEIFGDAGRLQFVTVATQFKGPVLDNDLADIVIANYTITEERKKQYRFTSPYYTDEIALLVKKDSGIRSLADMNGKTAGVARTSTSREDFQAEAAKLGITVKYAEFSSHPEIKAALLAGKVDAFVNDRTAVEGYLDEETTLLDEGFSPQPYGIAVKYDNDKLASYLENLLTAMRKDGRLDALRAKWGL